MLSSRLEAGTRTGTGRHCVSCLGSAALPEDPFQSLGLSLGPSVRPSVRRSGGGLGLTCLLPLPLPVRFRQQRFFRRPPPASLPFGPSRTMQVALLARSLGVWPRRSPLRSRNARNHPARPPRIGGGNGGNGLLLAYEFAWLQSRPVRSPSPRVRPSVRPLGGGAGLSCVS